MRASEGEGATSSLFLIVFFLIRHLSRRVDKVERLTERNVAMVCPLTPHRDVRADRSPPRGISPAPRTVPQALESRPPGKPGTFQKTIRSGSRPARRAGAAAEVDVIRRRRCVHPRLERVVIRRGADDRSEETRRFRSGALHGRHPRATDWPAPTAAPARGSPRRRTARIRPRRWARSRDRGRDRLATGTGWGAATSDTAFRLWIPPRRSRVPPPAAARVRVAALASGVAWESMALHAVAKHPRVERQSPSMPLIGEREETCLVYVL